VFFDGIDFYRGRRRYIPGYAWSFHMKRDSHNHSVNTDRKFLGFLLRRMGKIKTTGFIRKITRM